MEVLAPLLPPLAGQCEEVPALRVTLLEGILGAWWSRELVASRGQLGSWPLASGTPIPWASELQPACGRSLPLL